LDVLRAAHTFSVSMKFHLQPAGANLVTGVGPGWIRIGQQEYRENVILSAEGVRTGFAAAGFDALGQADFAELLQDSPDVVLLGTGDTQRFPHPRLTQDLMAAKVGLEVMDTRAACRTYNILVGEGRRVVAVLMV
jgi:uncharacterized protein